MSDYVIGDIQGCYEQLLHLLDQIQFNEHADRLWFVGDLVNRGPQSLQVLRFVKDLPVKPIITLGNHDLYLLHRLFGGAGLNIADDTLTDIIHADDAAIIGHWLRQQNIIYYDPTLNVVMSHAGIAPYWSLEQARQYALELENALADDDFNVFLQNMLGDIPNIWSDTLLGIPRLRLITNYFTRMRFLDGNGCLTMAYKGSPAQAPQGLTPWFSVKWRKPINAEVVFGHWASLQGQCITPKIYALDTGCLWGGKLTTMRLQDKRMFSVPGYKVSYS